MATNAVETLTMNLESCSPEQLLQALCIGHTDFLQRLDAAALQQLMDKCRHLVSDLAMKRAKVMTRPDDAESLSTVDADLLKACGAMNAIQNVSGVFKYTYPSPPTVSSDMEVQNLNDSTVPPSTSGKRQRDEEGFIEVTKRHSKTKKSVKILSTQGSNTPNNSISAPKGSQNSGVQDQAPDTQPKKIKIPPFFIRPPIQWDILLKEIKATAASARCATHKNFVRVQVSTENEYRAVQRLLTHARVEFKSFLLENDKEQKFVIRGLPINTSIATLKAELDIYEIEGLKITQLYRGPTTKRALLPLFLLAFPRTPFGTDRVTEISEIMGLQVTIEKFRGRKGPTQCHNCQGFFHSAAACHLQPRCVKCAERHSSSACPKQFEDPCCCANCGGAHPANYRACPKFPKSTQTSFKKVTNSGKPRSTLPRVPTKKVNPAISFAKMASGQSAQATPPPAPEESKSKSNSAPQIGAFSAAEFMNQILVFEKSYSRQLIARAFRDNLFLIQAAPSDMEKICILYEGLVKLSS